MTAWRRCSSTAPRRWWTTCTGPSPASGRFNPHEDVLELRASAGLYTHLDGPHSRVPVGKYKIGLIAQERKPHLTNAVVGDPRVGDQEWARRVPADLVVFGMVEEIEVFPAELESHPFIDREALEYAEVEVHTVGQSERVSPYVPKVSP